MFGKLFPRKDKAEKREKRKKKVEKRHNDDGYRGRRKSQFGVY